MILDKERETASRCVIVLEHPMDWSTAYSLFASVRSRFESTEDRFDQGCWFFLPGFTVFAADPSQEFFACVNRCVRRWRGEIKLCRFHEKLRLTLRTAERFHREFAWEAARDREPVKLPTLAGHIFRGSLFIDGCQVSTRTGQTKVMRIHDDDEETLITVRRRMLNLKEIRATVNIDLLERLARAEIEDGVRRNPLGALFVNPQFSVEAPTDSPTFYAEAMQRQIRWSDSVRRVFGDHGLHRVRGTANRASNLLTERGVLHVDGEFHELGAGPNRPPDRRADKRTLVSSRTITAKFLRLYTRDPEERPEAPDSSEDTGQARKPSVNGEDRNGRAH
jgi:hypothetical protein